MDATTLPWLTNLAAPLPTWPGDRSDDNLADLVETLRANPGRRMVWSRHASRGAARQRASAQRSSATWANYPDVKFGTYRAPDTDEYYLVIRADGSIPGAEA